MDEEEKVLRLDNSRRAKGGGGDNGGYDDGGGNGEKEVVEKDWEGQPTTAEGGFDGCGEEYQSVFDTEIERIGIGWFQYICITILGLGNASDAVELLAISYIIPKLPDVTGTQKGFVSAAVFLGMFVGGLLCGILSDRVGRKPCLLVSLLINGIFGCLSAAAPNWEFLVACRILSGVGVGGSVPSVFTLAAEFLPPRKRGLFITVVAWWWMIGTILAASIAWIIMGVLDLSWRYFAVAASLLPFVCFVFAWLWMPESPRYLYVIEEYNKAVSVLNFMARWNGKPIVLTSGDDLCPYSDSESEPSGSLISKESINDDVFVSDDRGNRIGDGVRHSNGVPIMKDTSSSGASSYHHHRQRHQHRRKKKQGRSGSESHQQYLGQTTTVAGGATGSDGSLMTRGTSPASSGGGGLMGRLFYKSESFFLLFQKNMLRTTVVSLVIWWTICFGWYGLIMWIPSIFEKGGFSLGIYEDTFLVAAANLPGNIVSAILIDIIGRRYLLASSMGIAGALAILLAFTERPIYTVPIVCLFNAVSVGGWNALDCLSAECFPTSLRSSAMGLTTGVGRLAALAAQLVNGNLIDYSVAVLLLVTSGTLLVGCGAAFCLPNEPANRKLDDTVSDCSIAAPTPDKRSVLHV